MRAALFCPAPDLAPDLQALAAALMTAGWTLVRCTLAAEIEAADPSLVIADGEAVAKLTGHPWIGWVRTGVDVLRTDRRRLERLLSFDGWIVNNSAQAGFIDDILAPTGRPAHLLVADSAPIGAADVAHLGEQVRRAAGFVAAGGVPTSDFIVRVGGRDIGFVRRALHSLARHTAGGVGAILVRYAPVPGLEAEIDRQRPHLRRIALVDVPAPTCRSTCLWAGLDAVEARLFGMLDDDDALHPNHVASLAPIAIGGVAAAGSVQVTEGPDGRARPPATGGDHRRFQQLPAADRIGFLRWAMPIHSSAFLADSSLLPTIGPDPRLDVTEDAFLLRRLLRTAPLAASWRVTTDFHWRADGADNTAARADGRAESQQRIADRERLDPVFADLLRRGDGRDEPAPAWGQPADRPHLPLLSDPADFWSLPAGRPVFVYGSGYGGRVVLAELQKVPHLTIAAHLDSRQPGQAHGLPVRLPADLSAAERADGIFIIASEHLAAMVATLRELGVTDIHDAGPHIHRYTALKRR